MPLALQHGLPRLRVGLRDGVRDLLEQVELVAEHRGDQLHPVQRGRRVLADQTAVA